MLPYLVDVIIPFHDNNVFLMQAIKSAKESKGVIARLILVNDTGVELSKDSLGLSADDLLVRTIGKGYVEAMQTGVQSSSARYVAFLDSDDIMDPDRLSRQIEAIQKTDADYISGRLIKFTENKVNWNSASMLGCLPDVVIPELLLLLGSHGADSALVAKGDTIRSSWNLHSSFSSSVADFGWLLRVLSDRHTFVHEPKAFYFYRSHQNQLSRNNSIALAWPEVFEIWRVFCFKRLPFLIRFNSINAPADVFLAIVFPSALVKLDKRSLRSLRRVIRALLDDLSEIGASDYRKWKKTLWRRYLVASRGKTIRYAVYLPGLVLDFLKMKKIGIEARSNK